MKIIEALSTRKSGLTRNEIIRVAKLEDNGLLTEMLKNLKDSLFVRAYNTFGYGEKNVVYQLADYFTLFYLRFMKGPPRAVGQDRPLNKSAKTISCKSRRR